MSYYKYDARDISLEGVDIGVLIAALYNNALTGGAGMLRYDSDDMTPDEGRHIFSELRRLWADAAQGNERYPAGLPNGKTTGIGIDYINGRSLKTLFIWEAVDKLTMEFSRFWDYNHLPVVAVVALARKGLSGRLGGQGILDVENEARILSGINFADDKSDAVEDFNNDISKRLAGGLEDHQTLYVENRSLAGLGARVSGYKILMSGNGPLQGEVGHLVRPYVKPSAP